MNYSHLQAYTFDLPKNLIAQTPSDERDQCRLLVADPLLKEYTDSRFQDIVKLLASGDALVINTSKVRNSRLYLKLNDRLIEVLLLERQGKDKEGYWSALCRPGKKIKVNSLLTLGNKGSHRESKNSMALRCMGREKEIFFFKFEKKNGGFSTLEIEEEWIEEMGQTPLPPYIEPRDDLREAYQTVYSKKIGSVAAPTAGLHFTKNLLNALKQKGVEIIKLDLQIGLGTFKPVTTENVFEHNMHAERYCISRKAATCLNECVRQGRNLYPVGTTSLRALEDNWIRGRAKKFTSGEFVTNIFIHPPKTIQSTSGLITNFHLPKSTLLMLVASVAGYEFTFNLYKHAISNQYRFYSFGDAMFLKNRIKNWS